MYLRGFRISGTKYIFTSYEVVKYDKRYISLLNIFINLTTERGNIGGFAKKMLLYLSNQNQSTGVITYYALRSKDKDIQLIGNRAYFEQKRDAINLYLVNGFKLRYYHFSVSGFYPAIISILPHHLEIFIPAKNVIRRNNLTLIGEDMVIRGQKNKISILSKKLLQIEIDKGVFFSNKIVFYPEKKKYILMGNVVGQMAHLPIKLEIKAENLSVKEGETFIKLYSSMPITFKSNENIVRATKSVYNKKQKKVTFWSEKFYVGLKKFTIPKARILTEKLSILKNRTILLANKFRIHFLDKSSFKNFAGLGVARLSRWKIDMIGTIYTKIFAHDGLAYISKRQYLSFNQKRVSGYAKNNSFFYDRSRFFADTLNVVESKATICNRYGIKINYIYGTKISSKCIKYYLDKEKLILPAGKLEK